MEQTQAAKSLVIILYQLVTEHVTALQKWASLKAYTILNALEIVFWAAVAVLTIQANVQMCVAPGCILGWGVAITGINLRYGIWLKVIGAEIVWLMRLRIVFWLFMPRLSVIVSGSSLRVG